jgi:hypothetical protein
VGVLRNRQRRVEWRGHRPPETPRDLAAWTRRILFAAGWIRRDVATCLRP